MRLYRLLLRLLPRHRRDRYGDEMAMVFEEQRAATESPRAAVWMREVKGMLRFAFRDRPGALGQAPNSATPGGAGRGPGIARELRWAWRNVRARGWRAAFIVGFFGVVLAANATLFVVVDSLVFRTSNLPNASELVSIGGRTTDRAERIDTARYARLIDAWNRQPQAVAAAGAYMHKTVFVEGPGPVERVAILDVTPSVFDVLGVKPRWGRAFVADDGRLTNGFTVIISESIARERFGRPHRAPGQTLEATAGTLHVVGVMSSAFAFPNASQQIWRALDLTGPLTRNHAGTTIARLARGLTPETGLSAVASAAHDVGAEVGLRTYQAEARPLVSPGAGGARRTMLLVLVGAALCLLLAACANAASLELAQSRQRARTNAVHLALGASRGRVRRGLAIEGALILGAAVPAAWLLAWLAARGLEAVLPPGLMAATQNPIDLDGRVLGYLALVAVLAWALTTLPAVLSASSSGLAGLLKSEDRSAPGSRGSSAVRSSLSVAQVALAVTLAIGGMLYATSFRALLAVEKGFDSASLASLSFTLPLQYYSTTAERRALANTVTAGLTSRRLVEAATSSSPPPSLGDSPSSIELEVDGAPPQAPVWMGANWVDEDYFRVVRLPLRAGRYLSADDPGTNVVVPDTFARRFWPSGDAVGHSFRLDPRQPWNTVVGVVGDFRSKPRAMPAVGDDRLFYYRLVPPRVDRPGVEPAAGARGPLPIDTGSSSRFLAMTLRLTPHAQPTSVLAAAREIDPRLIVTLKLVDESYAEQNADARLAGQVVGAFSVLAIVVAMAGVYGLMHFMVTTRRREIGVRMALGAEAADIRRLVLGSSTALVATGCAIGIGLALLGSRWMASQLFGVTPTDPMTYGIVAAVVFATALLATWQPARQAARIDPAVTLRTE